MPHSNGKIYTETRNGVRYGVTTEDVAAVLGQASLDVGTLCRASNINPWAKYKPIPCRARMANNTPAPLTDTQRAEENHGLTLANWDYATTRTPASVIAAILNRDGRTASYDVSRLVIDKRPWNSDSGEMQYARLSDFLPASCFTSATTPEASAEGRTYGYNHDAKPFVPVLQKESSIYRFPPLLPEGERYVEVEEGSDCKLTVSNTADHAFIRALLSGQSTVVNADDGLSIHVFDVMRNPEATTQLTEDATRHLYLLQYYESQWLASQMLSPNADGHIDLNASVIWDSHGAIRRQPSGNLWFLETLAYEGHYNAPIPGFCYPVTISRVPAGGGSAAVDIRASVYIYNAQTDGNALSLDIHVNYTQGRFTTIAALTSFLRSNYTALTATLAATPDAPSSGNTLSLLAATDTNWLFEYIGTADELDGTSCYVYSIICDWPSPSDAPYLVISATKTSSGKTATKSILIT